MSAREHIVVVTPWYPTVDRPYDGAFVADSVASLRGQGAEVAVVHLVNVATQALSPTSGTDILQVPFGAPGGTSRAEMAHRQAAALRRLPGLFDRSTAVHAHVGIPTGAAVAEVLPPSLRLVVTEHATYLGTELTYPAGRRLYRRVLDRADLVLAVSEGEARRIRAAFPDHRDRVLAAGNPVRLIGSTPVRPAAPLNRWLYVGNLIERKGVHKLLDAFGHWQHERRDATLTLAGSGVDEAALRAHTSRLGLSDHVHFLGAVRPAGLGDVFDGADVLVHLSELETFGMTVAEAALSGLPVVATRSGGPEQVLAHAAEVGAARLVSITASPAEVTAAVRQLEQRDTEDAAAIRAELAAVYGFEGFGRRLLATLRGQRVASDGPRIAIVAGSPIGHERLVRLAAYALARDLQVTAFVTDPAEATRLDPRIDVVDLGSALRWWPHHALDTALLDVLPAATLSALTDTIDHESRWRGRAARVLGRTQARHRRVADALRRRVLHPFAYGFIDPWLSTWLGRERIERGASAAPIAQVIATDLESRTTARLLADQLPSVKVTGVPSLSELDRLAGQVQES